MLVKEWPGGVGTGDWLLFMPKNVGTEVPLYNSPASSTTQPLPGEHLNFGLPYRLLSFSKDHRDLQIQSGTNQPRWIEAREAEPRYTPLKIPDRGLEIPGWVFLQRPSPPTGLRVVEL